MFVSAPRVEAYPHGIAITEKDTGYPSIDQSISDMMREIRDREMRLLFRNCMMAPITTSFHHFNDIDGQPLTYVSNGDIGLGWGAMWSRDAVAQFDGPYAGLMAYDPKLQRTGLGLVRIQARQIQHDPYANAFYPHRHQIGFHNFFDVTDMKPGIHERKWEPDSLAFPVRLAHKYWQVTGDESFADEEWVRATRLIFRTYQEQQRLADEGPYTFQRRFTSKKSEHVPNGGYGPRVNKVGWVVATHRPSDDACEYANIPVNLMVAESLLQISQMYSSIPAIRDEQFAADCKDFSGTIVQAVMNYGRVYDPERGMILAYEADGWNNVILDYDSSPPDILSIPWSCPMIYQNYPDLQDAYRRTRARALSDTNSHYHRGDFVEGIGSSHTGPERISTASSIMAALAAESDEEILHWLGVVRKIHKGTYRLGESTLVNGDGGRDTREWFPWPMAMFAELMLKIRAERHHLLAYSFTDG